MLLEYLTWGRFTSGWLLLIVEGGESETILLLIGNALINGDVGSMIEGKFSYGESYKTALFSLVLKSVGNAVYVFSIVGAFTISRLFLLATVG